MSDGRERGKVVVESQRVVDQTNRLSSARVSHLKRKRTHIEPENFGLAGSPIDVDDGDQDDQAAASEIVDVR